MMHLFKRRSQVLDEIPSRVVPPARTQSLSPELIDMKPERFYWRIPPLAVPGNRQPGPYRCGAAGCSNPSDPPQPYQYKEMRNSRTNFRLFHLQRGSGRQPIYGELLEHSLDDREVYDALSYRWEDVDVARDYHIHIDQRKFAVSESVLEALFIFRHDDRPRKLWIDQICINQVKRKATDLEKEDQVENMGKIYKNAESTLIWLGPDPMDRDKSAIELVRSLQPFRTQVDAVADERFAAMLNVRSRAATAGLIQADDAIMKNENEIWAGLSLSIALESTAELVSKGVSAAASLPQLDDGKIEEFGWLFQASWFRRAWPIQEVILSRKKVVHYGNVQIDWAAVGWVVSWIIHKYPEAELPHQLDAWMKPAMWVYDLGVQYSGGFPLMTMLRMSRKFDATDKKDKVYAIYGLVDFNLDFAGKPLDPTKAVVSTVPTEIKPNYDKSKTFEDVYYDVARYLLLKEKSLAILTATHRTQRAYVEPSWVPNWDNTEVGQPIWLPHASADNFRACSELDQQIKCKIVDRHTKRFYTCTVHGKRIGTVVKIYPFKETPIQSSSSHWKEKDWANIVLRTVSSLVASLSKSQFSKGKQRLVTALALLLTAGRSGSGSIVQESYAGSSAGKTVTEHVADFADFILDLPKLATAILPSDKAEAHRRLAHYVHSLPCPRLADARQGSYAHRCREATLEKTIFRTDSGMLGLGPAGEPQFVRVEDSNGNGTISSNGFSGTRVGDEIMILRGGRVPFILRPVKQSADCSGIGTHRLIGKCYVYGAMDKEFDGVVREDSTEFILV